MGDATRISFFWPQAQSASYGVSANSDSDPIAYLHLPKTPYTLNHYMHVGRIR